MESVGAAPPARLDGPADGPLRLIEQEVPKGDTDPKALACYGVLLRQLGRAERVWLRFVDGRPVSAITEEFLAWVCARLQGTGVRVWLLVWDNACWHMSRRVRAWIRAHNRQVKRQGTGVRIVACICRSRARGSTRSSRSGCMASAPWSSPNGC